MDNFNQASKQFHEDFESAIMAGDAKAKAQLNGFRSEINAARKSTGMSELPMEGWAGSSISPKRILILGESWYGDATCLEKYLSDWCNCKINDPFFSRVFNAAHHPKIIAASATTADRFLFWNSVFFDNFVNWPVGNKRANRPTAKDYNKAKLSLPIRLKAINPNSVWVLGLEQSYYSTKCLAAYHHIVSPHPCGRGVPTAKLSADWAKL